MRRFILTLLLCIVWSQAALADTLGSYTVKSYVDISPSFYNTAAFSAWLSPVYSQIAASTFVDMEHGSMPGTTNSTSWESVLTAPTYTTGNTVAFMFFITGITTTVPSLEARIVGLDDAGAFYMDPTGNAQDISDPVDPNFGWAHIDLWPVTGGSIATITASWFDVPDDALNQVYWRAELRVAGNPNQTVGLTSNIVTAAVPTPTAVWAGMVLMGTLGLSKLRQRKATRA